MSSSRESSIQYKSVAEFVREIRREYRNQEPAASWEETLKDFKDAAGVNVFGPNDPLEEREQHREARAWIQHVSAVFRLYIDHPEHSEDAQHLPRFSHRVVTTASVMLEYLYDVMVQSADGNWAVEWRQREILDRFLLTFMRWQDFIKAFKILAGIIPDPYASDGHAHQHEQHEQHSLGQLGFRQQRIYGRRTAGRRSAAAAAAAW